MSPHSRRLRFVSASLLSLVLFTAASVQAAVHNVTNGNDAGPGSYRQAILDAESDDDPIVIEFAPGLFVQLTSGGVQHDHGAGPDLTINGNGSTIDGGGEYQILDFNNGSADLTVNDITMQHARGGEGGAIRNVSFGVMRVHRSRFLDNFNFGAGGGAIGELGGGNVEIVDSLFMGNATSGGGGAVRASALDVRGSSFIGNSSGGAGGALWIFGTAQIVNSSFVGNQATNEGGAVHLPGFGATMTMRHVTLAANAAIDGAHLHAAAADLEMFAVVLAEPQGAAACGGVIDLSSLGYNYATDNSCGIGAGPGDVAAGTDPNLLPLADNGGPTPTRSPALGSPLIDAIPVAACDADLDSDQRGVARPQGDGCDIGALEVTPLASLVIAPGALDFGEVIVSALGAVKAVDLTNAGTATLAVAALGAPSAPFALLGGSCGDAPFTLQPGLTCRLDIGFQPTSDGAFADTLTVDSNAPSSPDSVALAGSGVEPVTYQVTHGGDGGAGSYRQAIAQANADAPAQPVLVEFDPALLVMLTSDEVVFTHDQPLLILGQGSTIDGGNEFRILKIQPGAGTAGVTVHGFTLQNGRAEEGAAIWNAEGGITVLDSTLSGNTAAIDGMLGGPAQPQGSSSNGGALFTLNGDIEVTGSTLAGNRADRGGAIFSVTGRIDLNDAVVQGNTAADVGGALFSGIDGRVFIVDSIFSDNVAEGSSGGALITTFDHQHLEIRRSRFLDNTAAHDGGALNVRSAAMWIVDSTFAGNHAEDDLGGAVASGGGSLRIEGSTFAGNTATGQGGAIYHNAGDLEAINSTFSGNAVTTTFGGQGGAVYMSSGTLILRHATLLDNSALVNGAHIGGGDALVVFASVLAGAQGSPGCAISGTDSLGYNYETGNDCDLGDASDTVNGGDPMLSALDEHGGPTPTHLPLPGSPLIDAIPTGDCATGIGFDQRGVARPQGSGCDIGAVEAAASLPELIFADGFE